MIGLVDGNNFFVSCERVFDPRLKGRAVAVLSNNDGCCVSRSNEFKALGIPMGTPHFKLRDREERGEVVFRSSNFELYGNLSNRIMTILREESVDLEQYSIDEAFIHPPSLAANDWEGYGRALRSKILKWVGIPCGIGFAPTKTLAKIADHIAKKTPGGVYVLPADPYSILDPLPVEEVWNVGRRLAVQLRGAGISTAGELARAQEDVLREIGGVGLARTAAELRGIETGERRDYDSDPESVSFSRTFGTPITTREALVESIFDYLSRGAEKLRRHTLLATGCQIYAQMGSACEHHFVDQVVLFPRPTDATNVMLKTVRPFAERLFTPYTRYRKSGIVFFGLEKADGLRQGDLFEAEETKPAASRLYKIIDSLNAKFGHGTIRTAAEAPRRADWRMKRTNISLRATTRWNELVSVN